MSYKAIDDVGGEALLDDTGDPLVTNSGPKKRVLIQRAYGVCGQSMTEFEISPEEYTAGLQLLNDVAGDLFQRGINIGYNYPADDSDGDPEEESGIAKAAIRAVVYELAVSLAPTIGKTLSAQAIMAGSRAVSALTSTYTTIPQMQMGRGTIRGAGNRRNWFGPYFVVDISDDEIVQ